MNRIPHPVSRISHDALLPKAEYEAAVAATRSARMKWWREARFGMFIHFGLYSMLGRGEQVQIQECIPHKEYDRLATKFRPRPGAPREWARLAKATGMKYMVLTTKHHDGFCLWNTKQTDFNTVKTGCGRDIVKEYVAACREFGLRVGLYYSLLDTHHPDGARCVHDRAARRRFVDFTHGCVRELMTNYGKIDILWYDVALPFQNHEGWETLALNQEVRSLQPHIVINDRSRLDEDFTTPEETVKSAPVGRDWESCMTMNGTSWCWMPTAKPDTFTTRDIVQLLGKVSAGGGNLLLNIGPAPNGGVPDEFIEPFAGVAGWLRKNGRAVYGTLARGAAKWGATACGVVSHKGNKAYFWAFNWAAPEMGLGGYETRLKSARLLSDGRQIAFEQKGYRIRLKDLPGQNPDKRAGIPVIELQFASPPKFWFRPDLDALNVVLPPSGWVESKRSRIKR